MNSVQSPTLQRRIIAAGAACMALAFMIAADASAAPTGKSHQPTKPAKLSPAVTIAVQYAEAIAKGDRVSFAKLDFACLYRLVAAQPSSAMLRRVLTDCVATRSVITSRAQSGRGSRRSYDSAADSLPALAFLPRVRLA